MVTTTPEITTGRKNDARKNITPRIFSLRVFAKTKATTTWSGIWINKNQRVFFIDFQNNGSFIKYRIFSRPTNSIGLIIFQRWNTRFNENMIG